MTVVSGQGQVEGVRRRIEQLRDEHHELENEIIRRMAAGPRDELAMRRLKKRKLHLKDEITRLEMALVPDIPA